MVEQQLEGDKVADLGLGNLVAAPVVEIQALPSTFLLFSSLLVFFIKGGWRLSWIFVTPSSGGWKEDLSLPFPHVQCPKMTLGHNPKGWWALAPIWAA